MDGPLGGWIMEEKRLVTVRTKGIEEI